MGCVFVCVCVCYYFSVLSFFLGGRQEKRTRLSLQMLRITIIKIRSDHHCCSPEPQIDRGPLKVLTESYLKSLNSSAAINESQKERAKAKQPKTRLRFEFTFSRTNRYIQGGFYQLTGCRGGNRGLVLLDVTSWFYITVAASHVS